MEKARSEGFNQGKAQAPKYRSISIEKIINEIGSVRGIGAAKHETAPAFFLYAPSHSADKTHRHL